MGRMKIDLGIAVCYVMLAALATLLAGGLIFGVVAGGTWFYQTRFTGPCAWKGGPSWNTQQDYIYCNNGERVEFPTSTGNSYTVRVRN